MASSLQQYRQELESRNLPSDLIDRMVRSRQKARSDVALQSGLGERIFDRFLGGASAGGYTIAGGLADLAGGLGGFLGGPFEEDAATLKQFADEAYRRAKPLALEGYKQGSVTASKGAVPIIDLPFYSETEMLANLQDKVKSPEYLGEFGGLNPRNYGIETKPPAPKLSEQEMANILSDVEGKSDDKFDLFKKLSKLDVSFADPSLAEANKKQTKILQDKTTEDEMLAASGALDATYSDKSKDENPTETAFMEAIKQFMADAGKEDVAVEGETKKQKLDRYKKEFEEATGIDASGKVDKSRALMAFGLSLMQNRAGSGFNVGRILSSVGEAGEIAMPELDKAIDRARAAKLAAGKYALEQIAADESAAAALAKEDREFQNERFLKEMQINADIEKEKIKAGAKGTEVKGSYFDEPIQGLKIRRGRTKSGPVFENPTNALDKVTRALQNTNSAITTVDEMIDLANEIDSADSSTFEIVKDRFNTILVGAGLADANVVFGESGIGKEQQVNALQDSIIAEFKRLLTQETGNGISNDDVKRIQLLLGKINLFGNTKESILRLNEIKQIFSRKRMNVRDVIDQLRDPSFYPTESEYQKNMERLPSLLGDQGTQYKIITSDQGIPRVQVKD